MKLSVVIPAHNEEACIEETVKNLVFSLRQADIEMEILCVNDNSTDLTEGKLHRLSQQYTEVNYIKNPRRNGFGLAVQAGLDAFKGDVVAIVMADGSDSPSDVVEFFKKIEKGFDCVFGSRFIQGGRTCDYPKFKRVLNRFMNNLIRFLFRIDYNDTTNAFKMYHRKTIEGLKPLLSYHFNLTVELPLKAIIRGYSYAVIPNSWTNRKTGESKLKLKEMGSRYFFIILYCLIEKWLAMGDYAKRNDSKETVRQP